MILDFAADLSRLDIHAQGSELAQLLAMDRDDAGRRVTRHPDSETRLVATMRGPVLVTDHHRICGLGPTLRDTVFALFAMPRRTTRLGAISLTFEQGRFPGVWGPSIDTLLFCRALGRMDLSEVKNAIEIGSGSGFISKAILAMAPALERMLLVDLDPQAIACSREQVVDPRVEHRVGGGIEAVAADTWDLVVSNPPYIPRPWSIEDNPYEGVGLLAHLLEHGRSYLAPSGSLVVNASSLADPMVARVGAATGARAELLDSLRVPLKVFNVLNSPEWLVHLEATAGLCRTGDGGYEYWHELHILRATR